MNPAVYGFLEACAPWLVLWSVAFTGITAFRVARRIQLGIDRARDSILFTEAAGLPLALLQSICFAWAALTGDWRSLVLFLWWGPGFLLVATAFLTARARGHRIDWYPWRHVIAWLCKGYYLAYVAAFLSMQALTILFAFSVWIINDQVEKAFMSSDADRLRRTFDDWWLFRILYPSGLFIPYFHPDMPFRSAFMVYGAGLFVAWVCGVCYVWRKGLLLERPADPSLLRNMVYFRRLRP